jgi:hypothetical protein
VVRFQIEKQKKPLHRLVLCACPLSGVKETLCATEAMSALPSKADMCMQLGMSA